MIFDPRDTDSKIIICSIRHLCHFFRFRAGEKIITGYIQRICEQTQRFQTGLTKAALIKTNRIEAFSDDIR